MHSRVVGLALVLALMGCGKMSEPPGQDVPRAAPANLPIYRAELAPQYERSVGSGRPVIRAGATTTLRLDIGPSIGSGALVASAPVSAQILRSEEDVPLKVLVHCGFCDKDRSFMQDLVYHVVDRRSNLLVFDLSAGSLPAQTTEADGQIQISVFHDRTGREYDRFVVDVRLRQLGEDATPVVAPFVLGHANPYPLQDHEADATLFVLEDDEGEGVSVSLQPNNPRIQQALEPLLIEADHSWRVFRRPIDKRLVAGFAGASFTRLSEFSLQGKFVKDLRRIGVPGEVSVASQEKLTLAAGEASAFQNLLGKYGQGLYRLLFEHGQDDKPLRDALAKLEVLALEAPADQPLMLKVVTDLALPWQYLHPAGVAIDPNRFWGMRFALAAQRINTGERAGPPATPALARKVVFARHAGVTDDTIAYADKQLKQLSALAADLIVVDSGKSFLGTALTDARRDVAAIFAFTHASSGRRLQAGATGAVVVEEAAGAALRFADDDIVTPDVLIALANPIPIEQLADRPYLSGRPLVVLNACESGGVPMDLPQLRLQDALFYLGARGIVTTEVSIWVPLGHAVGSRLMDRLGQGQVAPVALTQVRRALLAEHHNALGLLYAYHGQASLTMQR